MSMVNISEQNCNTFKAILPISMVSLVMVRISSPEFLTVYNLYGIDKTVAKTFFEKYLYSPNEKRFTKYVRKKEYTARSI